MKSNEWEGLGGIVKRNNECFVLSYFVSRWIAHVLDVFAFGGNCLKFYLFSKIAIVENNLSTIRYKTSWHWGYFESIAHKMTLFPVTYLGVVLFCMVFFGIQ